MPIPFEIRFDGATLRGEADGFSLKCVEVRRFRSRVDDQAIINHEPHDQEILFPGRFVHLVPQV